jgi:ribose 5-phosphate isomerase A
VGLTELKQQAGRYAVDQFVESGMVLGLGTGSTAIWANRRIGELISEGALTDIVGVPTSTRAEATAREVGIPLVSLDTHPVLDLTIDGADEIDPGLNLIKGGGGALLREKVVAQASQRMIAVADDRKVVERLGTTFRLPVEVIPFGVRTASLALEKTGGTPELRRREDGERFQTDNGNYILDVTYVDGIADLAALAATLDEMAAVMAQGLFLGLATEAVIAGADGVTLLHPAGR